MSENQSGANMRMPAGFKCFIAVENVDFKSCSDSM